MKASLSPCMPQPEHKTQCATGNQNTITHPHRPAQDSIPPPAAPVLHWICSSKAVRISLVKRSTEPSILFVESKGLSHYSQNLKLLFCPSQFAVYFFFL